ncbi:MAG: DUF192 domain-containing protein [Chloroflexota bacterium]|nr:DUF192 domain-containing protein [Chloroflexota bacterium]
MARYVRIQNLTRGTVVAERCRVARSLRERTVGLLGTTEPPPGDGLLIERTQSIHMFFMRYPIDVAFVDRSARVTHCLTGLRPWRVVWWARGARDCIELGVGTLAASGTEIGDKLAMAAVA